MKKAQSPIDKTCPGFSLVSVLLAVSIFGLIVTALVGSLIYGQESTAMAGARSRAAILADEGLEAVRSIRDENFSNLTDGPHGLVISGNQWTLSGTSDTIDSFTRQIVISSVDANRKQVTSTISWQQNPQYTGQVQAISYITNWRAQAGGGPTPTPTPTPAQNTCATYCQSLGGYTTGTCRQNKEQCSLHGEIYESGGNQYCTGGQSEDTCCCLP